MPGAYVALVDKAPRASYSKEGAKDLVRYTAVCDDQKPESSASSEEDLNQALLLLDRIERISVHGIWNSDGFYAQRMYRFLSFSAFNKDHTKILTAEIENMYDDCICCCFGYPRITTMSILSQQGTCLFKIYLTGDWRKQPMDTADIIYPDGSIQATVQWKWPYLCVSDLCGTPILMLKRKRFTLRNKKAEKILFPDTKEVLGKIYFTNSLFGPSWSDGYVLTTDIPPYIKQKQRMAWVALIFLLKCINRGKEYAKIGGITGR